ncbi:exonuclease [Mucilaginibacter robiniae]|uniref:Exonuclease n=1 Tax=Mucilaginibacter robiniae TaxID=2728022 RepID=A0A7L5DWS6_9SPHI|nr:MBL fold metallo-hydrolase [Mucilaginibacter robiniae]QJD94439.1 exonuclease [Mucilaginibacter robiniae]
MILDDFLVFDDHGLYCRYGDFYLDPQQPVQHAVISHAHADHAVAGNRQVYCTPATARFMQLRYSKNAGGQFHLYKWHQSFTIGAVKIFFIPAGHILGSAQVVMHYEGITYLYTGDYKLQPDSTCEPIEWIKADVLITESTFGNPAIKHPDPVEEIKKLKEIESNILLGAYGLGKAQRLIKLISEYAPNKKVLVHHRIAPINTIYEQLGYAVGNYQMYNRKLMKTQDEYVYLVPPFTFDSYLRATGVKRIFASGWKNLQVNQQDTLFISDHADWDNILYTVEQVSPKQIWTLHGDGSHLKSYFDNQLTVKALN